MIIFFLDSKKPISTCKRDDCIDCECKKNINCHFNFFQLFCFLLMVFPSIFIGVISIISFNSIYLILWIFIFIVYFGFVEIRVMCSHCPHYAEKSIRTLKCWANYGMPKIWKYRPGPLSNLEKIVFYLGMAIVFIYPVIFIILIKSIIFLFTYIFFIIAGIILLQVFYCRHCINFACPANRVDNKTREVFFENNPQIKKEWHK